MRRNEGHREQMMLEHENRCRKEDPEDHAIPKREALKAKKTFRYSTNVLQRFIYFKPSFY